MAGAGGILGLVLAKVGVEALLSIDPSAVPRSEAVSLNGSAVLFTLGVSVLTALILGLCPHCE